jgi:transcriptional regulator of acetoin/glycerol metabolism
MGRVLPARDSPRRMHRAPATSSGAGPAAAPEERARVVAALEKCHGNQTHAAKLLGVSRRTLITRMEAYGLPRPRKQRGRDPTTDPP